MTNNFKQILNDFHSSATHFNGKLKDGTTYKYGMQNKKHRHKTASYVAIPEDEESILTAIKIAKRHGLKINVMGGRHSYEGSCIENDDGAGSLCIDLRKMKGIETIGDDCLKLQGGVVIKDVVRYMKSTSLDNKFYFVKGGCSTVGMGFYVNGGAFGSGMGMRETAVNGTLASERIVEMKVATLHGMFVLNHQENRELFDAMKQIASSFGIVLSITIRLIPKPEPLFYVFMLRYENETELWDIISKSLQRHSIDGEEVATMLYIRPRKIVSLLATMSNKKNRITFREGQSKVQAFVTNQLGFQIKPFKTKLRQAIVNHLNIDMKYIYKKYYHLNWCCSANQIPMSNPNLFHIISKITTYFKQNDKTPLSRGMPALTICRGVLGKKEDSVWIELTAPNNDTYRGFVEELEYYVKTKYPDRKKYLNVPSNFQISPIEDYFPPEQYKRLCDLKQFWDPNHLLQSKFGI